MLESCQNKVLSSPNVGIFKVVLDSFITGSKRSIIALKTISCNLLFQVFLLIKCHSVGNDLQL